MNNIQLLDCTLRDGGHLTGGKFGKDVIVHVIEELINSGIDIVEIGFLVEKEYTTDYARFKSIKDVKRILPKDKKNSKISLMADFVDLSNLEENDGTVDIIRLSFKRHRLEWALKTARLLMDKGYNVFINPVNCNVYTDEQYLEVLHKVNELHPYGFSIVDTFGVLRLRDFAHLYYLVNTNLEPDIVMGAHLHENLGLAYSLAQHFISINEGKRDIVIDGSLLGMGRVPGNLCIEQIMDHMNQFYGGNYHTEAAFDAIDDCIAPIKSRIPWGYSIPYALSAKYKLHRTYAEYLMEKWKIHTSDIERILSNVTEEEAELFNEDYIENLYKEYISVEYDDTRERKELSHALSQKEIVVLAPGSSIKDSQDAIKEYVANNDAIVISIHFIPDFLQTDYLFYANIKRFEIGDAKNYPDKCIISSNLTRYEITRDCKYVIDYSKLVDHSGKYSDDSTLMLLHLLKDIGVKKVAIAGFDGFSNEGSHYYKTEFVHDVNSEKRNTTTDDILKHFYNDMDIEILTKTNYCFN